MKWLLLFVLGICLTGVSILTMDNCENISCLAGNAVIGVIGIIMAITGRKQFFLTPINKRKWL